MNIFRRRKKFIINEPDPSYNVIYLGNVLTNLAKGDGCADKALSVIWRTYTSRTRPDIPMILTITNSGLKAQTKQQGLTEYWAHRITYCAAPSTDDYPRLFCWIYKHEGKKLKPELRVHAVLCKKLEHPSAIALLLHEKIASALRDYKKEKIAKQNTRLSGTVSAGYPIPSIPQRKILLSVGGQNFRPPMNRSKSAPRLHSIDEECGREEDDEDDEFEGIEEEDEENLTTNNDEKLGNPTTSGGGVEDDDDADTVCASVKSDEMNIVNSYFPGTPKELEFRYPSPYRVDLEIGNDVEKLKIDERVQKCILQQNDAEADSISDESGYHDEKSSLEDDDEENSCQYSQVTAL